MVQSGTSPRVAIVGAGPSGLFAAMTLLEQRPEIQITVFDRIDKPFGLLRYGVAPDHTSFRKIQERLATVLENPAVTFETNRTLGKDLSREYLKENFDGIIYATGAPLDVELGVAGDDLEGSLVSGDLIKWYNGHPEANQICLAGVDAAAIVGLGNVAMDLARILAAPAGHLDETHCPRETCAELAKASVKDVWILGRRGPQHAAFTTPELREIIKLEGVRTVVHGVTAEEIAEALAAEGIDRRVKSNLTALAGVEIGEDLPAAEGVRCTVHFQFWTRPVEVLGEEGKVAAVKVEKTALIDGRVQGTGDMRDIPVQLIAAAIGYRGEQMEGIPFHDKWAIIPNVEGQVVDATDTPLAGEFVAGWAKRGATGVIGNAKSDGVDAAKLLLDYLTTMEK